MPVHPIIFSTSGIPDKICIHFFLSATCLLIYTFDNWGRGVVVGLHYVSLRQPQLEVFCVKWCYNFIFSYQYSEYGASFCHFSRPSCWWHCAALHETPLLWDGRKYIAKERKIKKEEPSDTQLRGEASFKWTDYKFSDVQGLWEWLFILLVP